MGLTASDVPELVRMATDESLNDADSDSPQVWAPVHAWRALGQLRAESAIEPLVGLFHLADDSDDDWIGQDMPKVMALMGPTALPALSACLQDAARGLWARIMACGCLGEVGARHPDARDECVAVFTRLLERFPENDVTLNAFLVSSMTQLNAVESAPVMERAFAENAVDISLLGDWEDVQIELGLLQSRLSPRQRWMGFGPGSLGTSGRRPNPPAQHTPPRSSTRKKKEQKKARRKNRRK